MRSAKKFIRIIAVFAIIASLLFEFGAARAGAVMVMEQRTFRTEPLLNPVGLDYSTYLGGSSTDFSDQVRDVAVDAAGNAYVTGVTGSADFPTTPGAFDTSLGGQTDAFVTKFDPAGHVVYSTFLGGTLRAGFPSTDDAAGIAVDSAGSAYVIGIANSDDFPTTPGAFDTTLNSCDVFVAKLNPSGSALEYSTLLGGPGCALSVGNGFSPDIAVDGAGSAYIAGVTSMNDFPTTPGAFDTTGASTDGFVAKLNPTGSALEYSTYLEGGIVLALTIDNAGNAYVAGNTSYASFPVTPGAYDTSRVGAGPRSDAFVTKLNPSGSALVYSTFLGGNEDDDIVNSIAVDSAGNAYLTGSTASVDFPTATCAIDRVLGGGMDAFVTKLNPTGTSLVYSTYLGGTTAGVFYPGEEGFGITVDASGNAMVAGGTFSADFPTKADAIDPTFNGANDGFIMMLNPSGRRITYSSFFGGSGADLPYDVVPDGTGSVVVVGRTSSTDYPTTPGALDTTYNGRPGLPEGFVTKMTLPAPPPDLPEPATIQLTPASSTGAVGAGHTVTATVRDENGMAVPNLIVRFSVTGATTTSGSCVIDSVGQCQFSYPGPTAAGFDTIAAYADTDADGVKDPCEPSAQATRRWLILDAVSDFASTIEDTAVTINVLANDTEPNGGPITVVSVTQGAKGSVVINADNTVTYSPAPNNYAGDSFTYTIRNTTGNTDTAVVDIFITPVNDPPVAHDGTAGTGEDVPVQITMTATDVDTAELIYEIVNGPANGTLGTVNGNTVIYTPNPNFNGTDSFTFKVNEVEAPIFDRPFRTNKAGYATTESEIGTITITVRPVADSPVLAMIGDQTISEGALLSLEISASDPDAEQLTFGAIGLPAGATLDPATGAFSWTPTYQQAGVYTVTFSVTDPTGRVASETITITVTDVLNNSGPVCSAAYPSIAEIWSPDHREQPISILGITDPDNDPLTITVRRIFQDEPTTTPGDGNTPIDGGGLNTSNAWVRAERSGRGNGRVYEIFFDASDGNGNLCTGSVKVGVPRDQSGRSAVDDGQRYDSTVADGPCLNCTP